MTAVSLSEQAPLDSFDLARAASAAAGQSFIVQGGKTLAGGRINATWQVETNEGPRVLRFSPETRRARQLQFELSLMTHLRSRGCRVPRVIAPTDGRLFGTLEGRPFCWMSFVSPGEDTRVPSNEELQELLLPVFAGLREFEPPFRPVAETRVFMEPLEALVGQLQGEGAALLGKRLRDLYEHLSEWERATKLPEGAIHADIYPENVLRDTDGKLWLIDFDDAHVSARALDWTLAALEFSWDGDLFRAERFRSLDERLTPDWAERTEREARDKLLLLLALKFACSEASLGTATENNRYLKLVRQLEGF